LVDTALTRASRRLQKNATAAPLALSLDRARDLKEQGEGRKRGSNVPCQDTGGKGFFTEPALSEVERGGLRSE
jgi:hypothetical protein